MDFSTAEGSIKSVYPGSAGRYHGSLVNHPQHENTLSMGTLLWFSPQHIFTIDEVM